MTRALLQSNCQVAKMPLYCQSHSIPQISFSTGFGFFMVAQGPLFCLSHARMTKHVQFHSCSVFFVFHLRRFAIVHRFATTELIQSKSISPEEFQLISVFWQHKQMVFFSLRPNSIRILSIHRKTRILRYNWYFSQFIPGPIDWLSHYYNVFCQWSCNLSIDNTKTKDCVFQRD